MSVLSARIARSIALAVTAGVLAACSTAPPGGTEGDGKTLTLASGQQASVQPLLDAFIAANPGVTVNPVFVEADAAYIEQLRTQLSAGTAPDVFKVWPGGGDAGATRTLAADGMLADLSGEAWADRVPDSLVEVSSLDGKLYSLPVDTGGIGAIYNDAALAEAGLIPPSTWSEVLAFCAGAKSQGKVAFMLGNKDAWTAQMIPYALTATLVYGPNPSFLDDQKAGRASFADSGWRTALEKINEMTAAGCFNEGPNGTSYDAQQKAVGNGDALAMVHVSQAIPTPDQVAGDATFTLKPLPATDVEAETYMPTAAGVSFAVNAKSQNPELAKAFLDFVASPAGQSVFAKVAMSAPALPADDSLELSPVLRPLVEMNEAGRTAPYPDQLWPNSVVKDEYLVSLQEFFNGDVTIDEFLSRMDEAFNS